MDILDFARNEVHYPLEYKLNLSDSDANLLNKLKSDEKLINASEFRCLLPIWKLVAIYQLHELLFSEHTTLVIVAESEHLAKKAYQTLLFPLNHIKREIIPELQAKTSHTISFSNGCEVKLWYPDGIMPQVQNKRVLVFCHKTVPADFKEVKIVSLGGVCEG